MVTTASNPLRVLLCTVLLCSVALAGCTDKDEPDDGPTPNPFVLRDREASQTDPVGDYARYYAERELEDCDGCIRLEEPDRDRNRHAHPEPATEPGVTLPSPMIGDHVEVTGSRRAPTGIELGGMPFATSFSGDYHFHLVLDALTTRGSTIVADGTSLARFQAYHAFGEYGVDGDPFTPDEGTWLVDLDTRAVVGTSTTGAISTHSDALIGAYHDQEAHDALHLGTPASESLFWLGAHLWGRTWYEDDTYTVAWTPPGAPGPAVWYDYRVTRAETPAAPTPAGGPHSHDHAPAQPALRVVVDVHDVFGKTRNWELRFSELSPYPTFLRLTRNMHASIDSSMIPPEIVWQTADVVRRGDAPVPWSTTIADAPKAAPTWDTGTFRIDERLASPALDSVPLYPLATAIDDLATLDPTFSAWWYAAGDAIIVDAVLEPRLAYSDLGATIEYQWTLTFLSGGRTEAWHVARLAVAPDGLAPAAHRAEETSGAVVPRTLRDMDPRAHTATALSSGQGLPDALDALGVTGQVDRAHYALTHTPEEGLGGTLLLGASLVPTAPQPLGTPGTAGHVVQDLNTGAVVDALVIDA